MQERKNCPLMNCFIAIKLFRHDQIDKIEMERLMTKRLLSLSLIFITAALFAGCFPHQQPSPGGSQAGFFLGIWHGWIAPLSLIVGLFDNSVRIYELNNTGWWYDLGFYIAIVGGFGGIALSRRRKEN
jgi:hypothetical protein